MIPVCSNCWCIRDGDVWLYSVQIDKQGITVQDAGSLTHGICDECRKRLYPEYEEGGD